MLASDYAMLGLLGCAVQDAHELLCGLLDLVQSEVLAREARLLGRTRVRISETVDPAARNFSFAVSGLGGGGGGCGAGHGGA